MEVCGLISLHLETLEYFLHSFYVLVKIPDGEGIKMHGISSPKQNHVQRLRHVREKQLLYNILL
jgi:hypothetical protein